MRNSSGLDLLSILYTDNKTDVFHLLFCRLFVKCICERCLPLFFFLSCVLFIMYVLSSDLIGLLKWVQNCSLIFHFLRGGWIQGIHQINNLGLEVFFLFFSCKCFLSGLFNLFVSLIRLNLCFNFIVSHPDFFSLFFLSAFICIWIFS